MAFIDEQLKKFKDTIEESIVNGGTKGKESCIRSSELINLIHDAVKFELIEHGIKEDMIFPHFMESKPEKKLAGFLKQKDQDVTVVPSGISQEQIDIDWGPMAFQKKTDDYGYEYTTNSLVINVRSQMSSLAKNADTLFERTFAEAMNLHMRYPNIVLGEVYLIPVYEYDDAAVKNFEIEFKNKKTDVEKYISFFDSINNRMLGEADYKYERCTLLVVDFRPEYPKLYRNSSELKAAGIISQDFGIEYATLGFDSFAEEIIDIYAERYNIRNIQDIRLIKRLTAYADKMRKFY